MANIALSVLLTACICWSSCLSQNTEQDLIASVREVLGEIKSLSQRVTELDVTMTTKFAELQSGLRLLQDSQNNLKEDVKDIREVILTGGEPSANQSKIIGGCSSATQMYRFQEMVMEVISCVAPSYLFPTLGCITPVTKQFDWEEARQNCLELGGRLLEGITDPFELKQLSRHFKSLFANGWNRHTVWLGFKAGNWVEGDPTNVTSPSLWEAGELPGRYSCGSFNMDSSPLLLKGFGCSSYSFYSLCQRK